MILQANLRRVSPFPLARQKQWIKTLPEMLCNISIFNKKKTLRQVILHKLFLVWLEMSEVKITAFGVDKEYYFLFST